MSATIPQITPIELRDALAGGHGPVVLDVRNPEELAFGTIPGYITIPLDELPTRIGELDKTQSYVIVCRSGRRSQSAAEFLASQGFGSVANLEGGILRWGEEVDPYIQQY